jgi:hypothetical protein
MWYFCIICFVLFLVIFLKSRKKPEAMSRLHVLQTMTDTPAAIDIECDRAATGIMILSMSDIDGDIIHAVGHQTIWTITVEQAEDLPPHDLKELASLGWIIDMDRLAIIVNRDDDR